jgi:hypothetical protein
MCGEEKGNKKVCKGFYVLRLLPWHDRMYKVPIDPMHLIKNIVSHCVHLIAGFEDSVKVRNEEKSRRRYCGSWVNENSDKLPAAPFILTKENIN